MQLELGAKRHFDERATREMAQHLHGPAIDHDEATPDDLIEVDADLNTLTGAGRGRPATCVRAHKRGRL